MAGMRNGERLDLYLRPAELADLLALQRIYRADRSNTVRAVLRDHREKLVGRQQEDGEQGRNKHTLVCREDEMPEIASPNTGQEVVVKSERYWLTLRLDHAQRLHELEDRAFDAGALCQTEARRRVIAELLGAYDELPKLQSEVVRLRAELEKASRNQVS